MTCFLVDENDELYVGLTIEKFISAEIVDDNLVINGILNIPTKDILEIKIAKKSKYNL